MNSIAEMHLLRSGILAKSKLPLLKQVATLRRLLKEGFG